MTDGGFAVMAGIVLLIFSGVGLILLIHPALHFRIFPNPLVRDTPWNRLQMRTVGLVLCLFVLLVVTGGWAGDPKRETLEGFHNNILVALWVSVFAAPIICWILWRFSVDFLVRRGHLDPAMEDPAWERGMAVAFCSLLLLTVLIALFLAVRGYHPHFKRGSSTGQAFVRGIAQVGASESAQTLTPASRSVRAIPAAIAGAPGVSPRMHRVCASTETSLPLLAITNPLSASLRPTTKLPFLHWPPSKAASTQHSPSGGLR
jgi:hypothetical protein